MNSKAICLIEDDEIMGESLCDRFHLEGIYTDWYQNAEDALSALQEKAYGVIISDIRLPDMSGETLFYKLKDQEQILPPFIFITGFGAIERAVALIKHGAADYITKPFDLDLLIEKIQALLSKSPGTATDASTGNLGISLVMRGIEASIPKIAQHTASVLITGETGVGKEHVARMLHDRVSNDQSRPFVAVNCGAFSPTLLESEIFGHEKGAFTGASKVKRGVFELAHNGTLLLDEIGEMPLNMQVHLLRIIQERSVTRLGGEKSLPVNVRLLFATNRDLKQMVDRGEFREDLFYRLNVIHLHIPPLRKRTEDILWFTDQFLSEHAKAYDLPPRAIDSRAKRKLLEHTWPGNLRELKHTLERACIMSTNPILTPSDLDSAPESIQEGSQTLHEEPLQAYIRSCEKDYIINTLEQHDWQIVETSRCLGISRKNLWEKMKKYDISEEKGL